jgi:pimeloyl-ACP methyl ester carboxylesterase
MYAAIMPQLAKGRRVITADLQAHGHTADVDRPLRYETMGDDVAGLIEHLGLAQADVMGYSFGAATALRLAIQHPSLVRRLVLTSIPCRREGWFPESLAGMDQMRIAAGRDADAVTDVRPLRPGRAPGRGLRSAAGQDR